MRLYMTLGFLILIISKASHVNSDGCLNCKHVNRWNLNCVDTYDNCDHCYDRFTFDPSNRTRCIEITIVEQSPEHKRAALGDEVELMCKFNVGVLCHWTLNDSAPKSQHSYVDKTAEDGDKRMDCSLAISSITEQDYGRWQCSNQASDETTVSVYSEIIQLLPMEKVIVHPDKFLDVAYGDNVILNASFDHPVECVWFKKKNRENRFNKVPIDERHHYLVNCGTMRDNCSFIIKNVDVKDIGYYQCNATATHYREAIGTNMAHVNVSRTIPIVLTHPTNKTNVSLDQKVELKCEFSSEVACEWLPNGTAIVINGETIGFRGCNENWTKDCSIIIYDFQAGHVGWYKCVNRDNKTIASEEVYVSLEEPRTSSQSNFGPTIIGAIVGIVIGVIIGIFIEYQWPLVRSCLDKIRTTQSSDVGTRGGQADEDNDAVDQNGAQEHVDVPQANGDNEEQADEEHKNNAAHEGSPMLGRLGAGLANNSVDS